ncbi:BgtAc-30687, partial [Blumeria graminis f. sp. tritici]
MKLSDRQDFDNFATNLKEYQIHKCDNVAFGENYLKDSVTAACEAGLNPHRQRYPLVHAKTQSKSTIYKWPLHYHDIIHGSLRRKHFHLKYFVLYTHENGPMRVIEIFRKLTKECSLDKKIIPPGTYDFDTIGAQESTIYDDKKSYDCSGQIFTDKYIQEILSTLKSEIIGSSNPSFRRDKYPVLEDIGQENALGVVWTWQLRIQETDSISIFGPPLFFAFANLKVSESNERYILAIDKNFQTFNVYYVRDRKYTVCEPKYQQVTSIPEYSPYNPEFNIECPDCGQCRYSTEWRCENNLANQKRRKIQQLDSDNNCDSGFEIPSWF